MEVINSYNIDYDAKFLVNFDALQLSFPRHRRLIAGDEDIDVVKRQVRLSEEFVRHQLAGVDHLIVDDPTLWHLYSLEIPIIKIRNFYLCRYSKKETDLIQKYH